MPKRPTWRQDCAHRLEIDLAAYVATLDTLVGQGWKYDGAKAKVDAWCRYVRASEQIAEKYIDVIPCDDIASVREWTRTTSGFSHCFRLSVNTPNGLHKARPAVEGDIDAAICLIRDAADSNHPTRDLASLARSRGLDPAHTWARFFLATIGHDMVTCISYPTRLV